MTVMPLSRRDWTARLVVREPRLIFYPMQVGVALDAFGQSNTHDDGALALQADGSLGAIESCLTALAALRANVIPIL